MKSYYYITRKEKGSFLIEVLLSMLILTGSILGVFKLIANNDNAEYDYIQRMVISTEIYNYYSICSVMLSRKFNNSDIYIKSHILDLSTQSGIANNCNSGVREATFTPTLGSNGYINQKNLWLNNVLKNGFIPLISPVVAIGIVRSTYGSADVISLTATVCYKSLNMKDSKYSFSAALPYVSTPTINVDGQPMQDILWCELNSMPHVNCRFYFETSNPDLYSHVNYKLPYTVERDE
ncbi:type IV pilus modification PilV family protein [Candidatus Ichthyocystis sparus]|nr:hypothetical protein [Candidatus Ichthyocystis sparus]